MSVHMERMPSDLELHYKTILLPHLRPLHNPSSQSLFTIGSVTAYTYDPSSTFGLKKINFF